MADTEKHAKCQSVIGGLCLCGTCKNDHGHNINTAPCCIKHYGFDNCPVIKCQHYKKEDDRK